jgi:hypothetical protein
MKEEGRFLRDKSKLRTVVEYIAMPLRGAISTGDLHEAINQ